MGFSEKKPVISGFYEKYGAQNYLAVPRGSGLKGDGGLLDPGSSLG